MAHPRGSAKPGWLSLRGHRTGQRRKRRRRRDSENRAGGVRNQFMNRLSFSKSLCLALGAIALSSGQDLTITNARTIGPNATVIERGSIVGRGGKIASVQQGAPSASSGKTIDAKGMTAMPGFIDGHRHINTGPNEKQQMQA